MLMNGAKHVVKIEEKIPLKQGLKHQIETVSNIFIPIEEKIPLKQGLKHHTSSVDDEPGVD